MELLRPLLIPVSITAHHSPYPETNQTYTSSRTSSPFMEAQSSLLRSQSPPVAPILSHLNPVPLFLSPCDLIPHLCLGLPRDLFPR
jgi:hypothetical protein